MHENDIQGPSIYDLVLFRSGELVRHARGSLGYRGSLIVNPRSSMMRKFDTLERAENYRHLPLGEYDCEFGYWSHKKKNSDEYIRVQAIRVLGEYSRGRFPDSRGRIYIHPANWPFQLTGCIGVGMDVTDNGIKKSRDALLSLFDHLGGWVHHELPNSRKIRLLVRDATFSERYRGTES